jgi:hypothetical protein
MNPPRIERIERIDLNGAALLVNNRPYEDDIALKVPALLDQLQAWKEKSLIRVHGAPFTGIPLVWRTFSRTCLGWDTKRLHYC